MKGLMLFFFTFLLCAASPSDSAAIAHRASVQQPDSLTMEPRLPSPQPRHFDEKRIQAYSRDAAFQYQENFKGISWWQRAGIWIYSLLNRLFTNSYSGRFLTWLLVAFGASALVFLIWKLLGMDMQALFSKKKPVFQIEDPLVEENIHGIDFEEELQHALHKGLFRQGVRLLYLQSLKKLADGQLIDWQPGKTNRTYVQELHTSLIQDHFASLTGQFEYIWYGGFPVEQPDFTRIQQQFGTFFQLIHS